MRDLLQLLSGMSLMSNGSGMFNDAKTALRALGLNNDPRNIQMNPDVIEMMDMRAQAEKDAVQKFAQLSGRIEHGRNNLGRSIGIHNKPADDWFDSRARDTIDHTLKTLSKKYPEFFNSAEGVPSKKITTNAIKRSYGELMKEAALNPDSEAAQFIYDNPEIQNLFTDIATKSKQATELSNIQEKNIRKRELFDEYGESSTSELKAKNNVDKFELINILDNQVQKHMEFGDLLSKKDAIKKEARQLSKNYRRGDINPKEPRPIQKIDKEYISQSSRNAKEIYEDLARITNTEKNKYIDVKKMKHAMRELKSLKGNHVNITPNKDLILSELSEVRPDLVDQLSNATQNRDYIFPTDLDKLNLTPDDYKILPRISNEMRYMGHQTHYTPARQLRDQIKGTAVGRWLEWVAPDTTLTTSSKGFDSLVDRSFGPFEKYMSKPNIVHGETNEALIKSHYDTIEELLKEHAKDTFFEDQINEALNGPDRTQHLEAYLNNPDAYIGDPSEGLAIKENFNFRRPIFEELFPMLSPKEATEVGDAMMSLGRKLGASNPKELLSLMREEPNLFLKELRAKSPNNPLARKSPYYITQYMNKPTNTQGLNLDALNTVNFDQPTSPELRRSFEYSGPLPEAIDYGQLNNEMERGGLRSVGDIVDDFREMEADPSKYSDTEYEDARSSAGTEYEDAQGEIEISSDSGVPEPHEMDLQLQKAVGPMQRRLFPKSFDKYAGKALKVAGKVSDAGLLIDGAYTGSENALGYKELIQQKGLLQGGVQGFKDQMGRAFNYVNNMYEDAKSSSLFHKLNEYLPSFDYYKSDNVNQDVEDSKTTGNIITDTGNKISNTGFNLQQLVGGSDEPQEFYGDNVIGMTEHGSLENTEPQMETSAAEMPSMGSAPRPHQAAQSQSNPNALPSTPQQNLIMNPNLKAQL